MKASPCKHCGALRHSDYEDGLIECRDNLEGMLETATDNAIEWKTLAGQLRAQESAIHGILADVDEYERSSAWVAVERIRALVSTPAPTPPVESGDT